MPGLVVRVSKETRETFNYQQPVMDDLASKSDWASEKVFDNSGAYFEDLISSLGNATKTINLDYYIFEYDALGKRVIEALIAATNRGVKVQVIVDGIGSERSAGVVASILSHNGIRVNIFNPLPWYLNNYRWSLKQGRWLEKMFHFFASLNTRDHRKLCTIDSKIAFCGSLNIAQYHVDAGPGKNRWHDYGVKLEGKNVAMLDRDFYSLWYQRKPSSSLKNFTYLLSNASPLKRSSRNKFVSGKIAEANRRISICTAYFSPSGPILKALAAACDRGVEVRLIVGNKSDVFFFPLLTATYYTDLLRMGVRVFVYQRGILHAKLMLIDEKCIIGSSNLNHRSYYHDLELDVVLDSASAIGAINTYMERDIVDSLEIKSPELKGINRVKLLGWLPRIFRYWS